MTFELPYSIKTKRLILSPWKFEEAGTLSILINDNRKDLERWTTIPFPYGEADAKKWILGCCNESGTAWAIRVDGKPIGTVGLHEIDKRNLSGELGYWIDDGHKRKGYVSEACRAIVEQAFSSGLQRVGSSYLNGNEGSWGVMRSLGFVKEGVRRKAKMNGGHPSDLIVTGVLIEDFRETVKKNQSRKTDAFQ